MTVGAYACIHNTHTTRSALQSHIGHLRKRGTERVAMQDIDCTYKFVIS